jgi:hypothetical protein
LDNAVQKLVTQGVKPVDLTQKAHRAIPLGKDVSRYTAGNEGVFYVRE